jgi:hypothetical protein
MSAYPLVPAYSEQWGDRFIATLHDYISDLERSVDEGDDVETISGEPFCGCSDCYEREAYLMALKLAIEGYEAGEVRLVDAE